MPAVFGSRVRALSVKTTIIIIDVRKMRVNSVPGC
jgi:hypothetical protein